MGPEVKELQMTISEKYLLQDLRNAFLLLMKAATVFDPIETKLRADFSWKALAV